MSATKKGRSSQRISAGVVGSQPLHFHSGVLIFSTALSPGSAIGQARIDLVRGTRARRSANLVVDIPEIMQSWSECLERFPAGAPALGYK